MTPLMSVDDAISRILSAIPTLTYETVPLLDAFNRVLAQDIIADEDLPPFTNSSMDGYALVAKDTLAVTPETPTRLTVVMDLTAGRIATRSLLSGEAARIMTGAPLPDGATAVVPVEDTDARWMNDPEAPMMPEVMVYQRVQAGSNVRLKGESVRTGDAVMPAGTVLRGAEVGILASLGITHPQVIRKPRVAILTSGDEVVRYDEQPTLGSIRDANSPALAMFVQQHGGIPLILPIASDTPDSVRAMFHDALALQPDMIISTAGVSVGAADFTRIILEEVGMVDFWRINLRPGKPLAFGNIGGVPFFGLPGNPVSALVTFDILVRPALRYMAGHADDTRTIQARTTTALTSDGRRSYLRVRLHMQDDVWYATQTGTQSSGALMSLLLADGLMIVPEGVLEVAQDAQLTVKLWRDNH